MKYILRLDNGTIKSGNRCIDEPRYEYFIKKSIGCDIITHIKSKATIFTEEEANNGISVYNKNFKLIPIK